MLVFAVFQGPSLQNSRILCSDAFGTQIVMWGCMSFFTLPSMLRAVFMDETFKIDICVFCNPLRLSVLAQMPAWRGEAAEKAT